MRSSRAARVALFALVGVVACGDDSTDPDDDGNGFDPADLIGTYVLDPSPSMTCNLALYGTVVLTVDTVEVTDATQSSLTVRLPVRAESTLFDDSFDAEFDLAFDAQTGEFSGSSPLDVSVPAGFTTIHGDGDIALEGAAVSEDAFEATVDADFAVAVGDATPTPCTSISLAVEGTRD